MSYFFKRDTSGTGATDALPDGEIFVGDGSNTPQAVAMSGGATISNTGVVSLSNAAIIAKVLTGYVSGAGTVASTDSILQAIQKLNGNVVALTAATISATLNSAKILVGSAGNVATAVDMSGGATITNAGVVALANSHVIAKVLTGFVSGAGTVDATDSILSAIQKLDGNIAAITLGSLSLADTKFYIGGVDGFAHAFSLTGGATCTNGGVVSLTNSHVIAKVLTGFTAGAGTVVATDSILQAFQKLAAMTAVQVSASSSGNVYAVGATVGAQIGQLDDAIAAASAFGLDIIVGSAQNVTDGVADYSVIADAITAATAGNKILILAGTFTENIAVSKRLFIEGKGYDTVISGTLTINDASDFSLIKQLKVTGNITFDAASTGNRLTDIWQTEASTITDNGDNNLYSVTGV